MRRFFSRNKDNKEQAATAVASSNNDKASTGVSSKNQGVNKTGNAAGLAAASPSSPIQVSGDGVGSTNTASTRPLPVTPSKQVAFAVKTLPATPEAHKQHQEYDDVHPHASYHGGSPAGSTRPSLGCFPISTTTTIGTTRSASNPAVSGPLLSIPSQPTRHASLDVSSPSSPTSFAKDRDATLRAMNQTQAARGEIPRFESGTTPTSPSGLASQQQQQQQRSTTSMSQNTSISTSSSLLEARQAFYGSNNHSSNSGERAYYPNLAILATYSRDMSFLNNQVAHSGGQHNNSIMQHLTWSEITDEQLVENLGGRERTRQEVLFEMVCSEERYVQELISLKENYLQPLLERHTLSATHFPTASSSSHDGLSASTTRSLNAPAPSIDAPNYSSATMKSVTSIDSMRRPYLSLSAGSTSHGVRYASPMPPSSSDHGHGHSSSRAGHHRASETHPTASSDHLPIAARFARRVSIDSPPATVADKGSTNTTRTAVDADEHGALKHGRRDISGGSGTTALDSGEETDASSPQSHRHARFSESRTTNNKANQKSRLHPLFANLSSSARHADKENKGSTFASTTSVDAPLLPPKTFRHHLKNLVPPVPNKLHKVSSPDLKGGNRGGLAGPGWVVKGLPNGLKIVSEVVADQILPGHQTLSERLRARYEEQYPLVRSLADVFHDQAWMIQHYATYVLHLEKALADIEETLSLMNPLLASNKKVKSKDKELVKEQKILAKIIMHLEEQAAMKGAPGLSICLSQPFQRLLKYPLLFQSLLYHTDPSTRDYDATQKLAFEIDGIVRSIENEKASEEDRSKTRDIWARIEGINDRALLAPRADRILVSEAAMWSSSISGDSAVAAGRRTFSDASRRVDEVKLDAAAASKKKAGRRFSDMTGIGGHHGAESEKKNNKQPSIGSKRDVWLVTFTDVVIRCQRIGVTNLPMQSSLGSLGHSSAPNKESHRRTVLLSTRERNLYKFQKVDHWIMEDKTTLGTGGIVNMDAMAKSRRTSERIEESGGDDDGEDFVPHDRDYGTVIQGVKFERQGGIDMNENASRMSFAYSSNEPRPVVFDIDPLVGLKIEGVTSQSKPEPRLSPTRAPLAPSPATQQAARKRGLAAAKFSNRLRPSTAEASNFLAKRAVSPSQAQHPPRSASATYERDRGGFNKPTAASLAKVSPATSTFLTAGNKLPRPENSRSATPEAKRVRAASSNASPRSNKASTSAMPPAMPSSPSSPSKGTVRGRINSLPSSQGGSGGRQLRTKHSSERLGRHGKMGSDTDSGVALYNQYWQDDKTAK